MFTVSNQAMKKVIDPIDRAVLRQELNAERFLRSTRKGGMRYTESMPVTRRRFYKKSDACANLRFEQLAAEQVKPWT